MPNGNKNEGEPEAEEKVENVCGAAHYSNYHHQTAVQS
jgi:hypothetical protein